VQRKYELTKKDVIEKWARNYPKVIAWLGKLQRKGESAWYLWLFCKTIGKTPDELLTLKDDPKSREAEYLLDSFVADESLDIPHVTKVGISIAVKSFFAHSYRELARKSGQISFEKKKPYRRHTKEELLKIYRATFNPRDRALITFTWSTAIARESLSKVQWKHLEPDWENQELPHIALPDKIVKGHGVGKYKGVEQHTFLTPEAKRDLLDYKDFMERVNKRKITSEDHIWLEVNAPYEPLGYDAFSLIAEHLTQRTGIAFSWHDARRYVETALEETKINPNWARKIRGRKVRGEEAPYSRPAIEQLRAAYKEAVPLLEFTQSTQPKGEDVATLAKLEALKAIAKTMGITDQQLGGLLGRKPFKPSAEYIKDLERLIAEKRRRTETNGGQPCDDGDHCGEGLPSPLNVDVKAGQKEVFEQVSETQLLEYLRNGWQIVHRLATGEVIVKR